METAAGHSGSVPVLSSHLPQRKEWRAISEHNFRNNGEESEHLKLGQADERTIYEEGTRHVNFDLCSVSIDGEGLKEDILQIRIQEISRQREELQRLEIELRAQAIAKSEIMKMQNHYRSQLKEQVDATNKLKEQLQEKVQEVSELQSNLEAKNRELHAVKIDTEAVWAKEDLFREQNKELATFRRDRDISEVERGQHLKKIHDLQEHIQEKQSQFLVLEEQHRVAQETILYKDEQLREVQAWMARVQEADVLQSTTNQSLQAELRERTEHFNQYWMALQRQFVEMEHHHLQTIQQLHLELAEVRGRSGLYQGNSQIALENKTEPSVYLQNKGSQANVNDGAVLNGSFTFGPDGKYPVSSTSTQIEHVPIIPTVPGMGGFLPNGQMTLHPFLMHQPGVPESLSSTNSVIPQSSAGHLQPMSAMPVQHWQNQLEVHGKSEAPDHEEYHISQLEQDLLAFHSQYNHEHPAAENAQHPEFLNSRISPQPCSAAVSVSNEQMKVLESNDKPYQIYQEMQGAANPTSNLLTTEQKCEQVENHNIESAINESQTCLNSAQMRSASNSAFSVSPKHRVDTNNTEECNKAKLDFSESLVSTTGPSISMYPNKTVEPALLDERALLACIVRAIPAGSDGRIRISNTLPNRLGKMLAPLHWNDYTKRYGKLEDFVSCHPEAGLFVIEGDYIHLCEGAQEIISATAAVAKIAAAAASYSTYSSMFPSVAVTPISQASRHKKNLFNDSKCVNTASFIKDSAMNIIGNSSDKYSHVRVAHKQHEDGLTGNVVQGLADIDLSSTSSGEKDGNIPSDQLNTNHIIGNGLNKAVTYGRIPFGGKKQGRASEARTIPRR